LGGGGGGLGKGGGRWVVLGDGGLVLGSGIDGWQWWPAGFRAWTNGPSFFSWLTCKIKERGSKRRIGREFDVERTESNSYTEKPLHK